MESNQQQSISLTLSARPDRRLIRVTGSTGHIVYSLIVPALPESMGDHRSELALALVLDRSGSMSGDKIEMAKKAALTVLDQLGEQDQVAVVIYDEIIDTLQTCAFVTPALKTHMHSAFQEVQARGTTALHEGWLRGCDTIADRQHTDKDMLARCFLLTDGLANVGMCDPEQIASDAMRVRREKSISTSTFGIGEDYDENLLGPMAVAGGGQFHHLRDGADIIKAFTGELGDLFHVAARRVILEIKAPSDVRLDIIGAYSAEKGQDRIYRVDIGDLPYDANRQIVIQANFAADLISAKIQAQLIWQDDAGEHQSPEVVTVFTGASNEDCDAEMPDDGVLRLFSQEFGERARRESLRLNQSGQFAVAVSLLEKAIAMIEPIAARDPQIAALMEDLNQLRSESNTPINRGKSKELYYRSQLASRQQKNYRDV
jgi:Ca-activated chloride channel homolog